ncbi:Malto-oligosyltrehalose trehalohydrolase OS=Streptomyces tendae OX=1932 GN=treZ PE=3 SV=1 [Streptomyces tendae]
MAARTARPSPRRCPGYFHDGSYSSFRGRSHGGTLARGRVAAHRPTGYSQPMTRSATAPRLTAWRRWSPPGCAAPAATLALTVPFTGRLFMG